MSEQDERTRSAVAKPVLRRWMVLSVFSLLLGIVLAIAVPTTARPDCPPPNVAVPCGTYPDHHGLLRLAILVLGALPLLLALHRSGAKTRQRAASGVLAAAVVAATVLILQRGWVQSMAGDCPPYPICLTKGRPYGGVAFILLVLAAIAAWWLWPTAQRTDMPGQSMTVM